MSPPDNPDEDEASLVSDGTIEEETVALVEGVAMEEVDVEPVWAGTLVCDRQEDSWDDVVVEGKSLHCQTTRGRQAFIYIHSITALCNLLYSNSGRLMMLILTT